MQRLTLILSALAFIGLSESKAQLIDFDEGQLPQIDVWDGWEASPFRTEKLKGHVEIVESGEKVEQKIGAPKGHCVALQRSRYGSNTFGVRIELGEPIELSSKEKYLHVMIRKPVEGRALLLALGKRRDRKGQRENVVQVKTLSMTPMKKDEWSEAVFPVKGHDSVLVKHWVIVPDAESRHHLSKDFVAYIDNIWWSEDATPRYKTGNNEEKVEQQESSKQKEYVVVTQNNRNGEIRCKNGQLLDDVRVKRGDSLTIQLVPAEGFVIGGIRLCMQGEKAVVVKACELDGQGVFTIPQQFTQKDLTIEGLFVER